MGQNSPGNLAAAGARQRTHAGALRLRRRAVGLPMLHQCSGLTNRQRLHDVMESHTVSIKLDRDGGT